ncbi:MAG TPA: helix-turn-helix domain-containing protein [Candidatus Saccharimonadia bacterium]|nr:helix-turn-helix domain-containing protein [Candidatus Saccharimonadia bacterium]
MKNVKRRSDCPISGTLDIVGDRWSLLILREMIFGGKTSHKEFSELTEKIATNILAERLEWLAKVGLIQKLPDPNDGRRSIYRLTEKGVDMLPVLLAMIDWGMKYTPDAQFPRELVKQTVKNRSKLLEAARSL